MKKTNNKNKIKLISILFLSLFVIEIISHLDFGQAKLTSDEEDLTMNVWGSMSTSSNELVGAGNTMGLGVYIPNTPKTWYLEPSATNSEFEFSNMQMDFGNIHAPVYGVTPNEGNVSVIEGSGNYTTNSSTIPQFDIAAGKVATFTSNIEYHYNYSYDNISSYSNSVGSNNSATMEDLQEVDGNSLELTTTGDYQYYANSYPLTYTYGSTGSGSTADTRVNDGTTMRMDSGDPGSASADAYYNSYHVYAGEDWDQWIDAFDWAHNDDGDECNLEINEDFTGGGGLELRGYLISKVYAPYASSFRGAYFVYSIDYDLTVSDPSNTYFYRNTKTLSVKSGSSADYTTIVESSSSSETDASYWVSDWSPYVDSSGFVTFKLSVDIRATLSGGAFHGVTVELNWDRMKVDSYYDYKLQSKIDYPNVASGYRLYYDITMSSASTPEEAYFMIGTTRVSLSIGSNENYIDTTGFGQYLDFKCSGNSPIYLYIDYLLCYDRSKKFQLTCDLDFDYENKSSIDNVYNISLCYKVDISSNLFKLQYSDAGTWIDYGYLTSTIYTSIDFQITAFEPSLRIYMSESAYTHEDVDEYKCWIDEVNMTTKYEPFIGVWTNFSYEKPVGGITYNETQRCSFGDYFNTTWSGGNVTYVFDSYMFEEYSPIITMRIIEQQINYTFQVAFKMNVTINFTVQYSSVEWKSASDIDFTLNDLDIMPLSPNRGMLNLYEYPDELDFEASEDIRFNMSTILEFYFTVDLEIISRSHLRQTIKLTSDHMITLNRLTFDSDLDVYAVYFYGDTTPYYPSSVNNSVNINFEVDPGETVIVDVYLEMYRDIYKELEYFYDYLGSGTCYTYLEGTCNTYLFEDKTKLSNWRINLPVGFELRCMDLVFSHMRYLPDYTSNPVYETYDYGYYSPTYRGDVVNWYHDYIQTNLNGTKLLDVGGSDYYNVYTEDFTSVTGEMTHENTFDYNSTYSVNNKLQMQNTFPQEFKNETYDNWNLDYNSIYSSSINSKINYNVANKISSISIYDYGTYISGSESSTYYNDTESYVIDGEYSFGHYDIKLKLDMGKVIDDNSYYYIYFTFTGCSSSGLNYFLYDDFAVGEDDLIFSKSNSLTCSYFGQFFSSDIVDNIYYLYIYHSTHSFTLNLNQFLVVEASDYSDYVYNSSINTLNSNYVSSSLNPDIVNGSLYDDGDYLGSVDGSYSTLNSTVNGTYLGIYSFTNDLIGSLPNGWLSVSKPAGTDFYVVNNLNYHRKCYNLRSINTANIGYTAQVFSASQTSGTIEFWYYTSNSAIDHADDLRDSSDNYAITFGIVSGAFKMYYSSAWQTIQAGATSNRWYHFRIDFECGSGGYLGLSPDTCNWWIDGTLYANKPFRIASDNCGRITLNTGASTIGTSNYNYYDAFGYSWDMDYEIGMNRVPTFYFGDYNSTYTFENDFNGACPQDFVYSTSSGSNYGKVISEYKNHSKVVEIYATGANSNAHLKNNVNPQTTGVVEFWYTSDQADYRTNTLYYLKQTSGDKCLTAIGNNVGGLQYIDNSGWVNLAVLMENCWYHVKIEFDCSTDLFNLYVENSTNSYSALSKTFATAGIDYFDQSHLSSWNWNTASTWSYMRIDAIGYNWSNLGNYPATYSFDNTAIGSDPTDWTDTSGAGCTVQVITNEDEHNKVMELYDNSGVNPAVITNIFSEQSYGTIEFYLRITDASKQIRFVLYDGAVQVMDLGISGDTWFYNSGAGTLGDIPVPTDNTWYHVRIDFDCTVGGYEGLGQYEYTVYIDGLEASNAPFSFQNNQPHIDTVQFYTLTTHTGYYAYVDAVGYSWDKSFKYYPYEIGDNENNGYNSYIVGDNLLPAICPLNFTTTFQLPVINYLNFTSVSLNYSYISSMALDFSELRAWNFQTSTWDLINDTVSTTFYNIQIDLGLDYLNSTHHFILNWSFGDYDDIFSLYIELLNFTYFYTGMGSNISATLLKTMDFSFLNEYDIGYESYQKLFNITIQFQYKFENGTVYCPRLACFNSTSLTQDGDWHEYNWNFLWDSASLDEFDVMFNITNGELQVKDMNYTIIYECISEESYVLNKIYDAGITSVCFDMKYLEGYWYYADVDIERIKKFTNDWSYIETIDLSTYFPEGTFSLAWDGSYWYIFGLTDFYTCAVGKFEKDFTYITMFDINSSFPLMDEFNIEYYDSNFYISTQGGLVKKFDSSLVYQTTYDISEAGKLLWSIVYYENSFLVTMTQGITEYVYRYSTDFSTKISSYSLNPTTLGLIKEGYDKLFWLEAPTGDVYNFNLDSHNEIYQYFKLEPTLSLDYLQMTRGCWILNFTLNFTASSDYLYYDFYNSVNNSLLLYRLWVESEDGWFIYNFNTNSSFNSYVEFNITQFLLDNGRSEFHDFYFELYLAGNPSNISMDDMILWDFDSDFYEVYSLWIDDSIVVSHQNLTIYWKASDRYISHLMINQTFEGVRNDIFNITLINNTLQSVEFYNFTNGFYEMNFTFYDLNGNYEVWTLNFTIISGISLSVAFQNPHFINTNNTIYVNIQSESLIYQIYYDNSTSYLLQYNNESYPLYQYNFNFTVRYSIETQYNISVLAFGYYGDSFYVNISFICCIERTTILDIMNLKSDYDQDDIMSVRVSLKDMYNVPIQNKLLNYTIEYQDGTSILNSSAVTNSSGLIGIGITFDTNWTAGFYHLNCSFNGTQDYMGCWEMMSFEILPIVHTITNSSTANLTVRGIEVGDDNRLNITDIEASSFDLEINNTGTLTFDLLLANVTINRSQSLDYEDYVDFDFTFEQSNSIFEWINFTIANMSDIPNNFTYYYFNGIQKSTYTLYGDVIQINDLIYKIYHNDELFEVQLRYIRNQQHTIQLTGNPRTDSNSVMCNQRFIADYSYKFWYFQTNVEINDIIDFEHLRTGEKIEYEDFVIEEGKYKFYLGNITDSTKTLTNDIFNATINFNPGWSVSYTIISNNGTYCTLQITYKANMVVNNVTIIINLLSEDLYADNWSNNATESTSTFILELPYMNFTTSYQTIALTGISDVPYADFGEIENEESIEISYEDYEDLEIWYNCYLEYPKYSKSFIVDDLQSGWELDGIRYSSSIYDVEDSGYFECPGWGVGITTSYIRIKTNPITSIERVQGDDYVEYTIECILPIRSSVLIFYIQTEQRFTVEDDDDYKIKRLPDLDIEDKNKKYYMMYFIELDEGRNRIRINFTVHTIVDDLPYLLLFGFAVGGLCVFTYVRKRIKSKEGKVEGLDKKNSRFLRYIFFWKKDVRKQISSNQTKSERSSILKFKKEKKESKKQKKQKKKLFKKLKR